MGNNLINEEIIRIKEIMGIRNKNLILEAFTPRASRAFTTSGLDAALEQDLKTTITSWANRNRFFGSVTSSFDDVLNNAKRYLDDLNIPYSSDAHALALFAGKTGKASFNDVMTNIARVNSNYTKRAINNITDTTIRNTIDGFSNRISTKIQTELAAGTLDASEQQSIRNLIDNLKNTINGSTLDDAIKDQITSRLDRELDELETAAQGTVAGTVDDIMDANVRAARQGQQGGGQQGGGQQGGGQQGGGQQGGGNVPPVPGGGQINPQTGYRMYTQQEAAAEILRIRAALRTDRNLQNLATRYGLDDAALADLEQRLIRGEINPDLITNNIVDDIQATVRELRTASGARRTELMNKLRFYSDILGTTTDVLYRGGDKLLGFLNRNKWRLVMFAAIGAVGYVAWDKLGGLAYDTDNKACAKDNVEGFERDLSSDEQIKILPFLSPCSLYTEKTKIVSGEEQLIKCPANTIPATVRVDDTGGTKKFVITYQDGTSSDYDYENPTPVPSRACSAAKPEEEEKPEEEATGEYENKSEGFTKWLGDNGLSGTWESDGYHIVVIDGEDILYEYKDGTFKPV